MMLREPVGFIGLGNMGSALVERLLDAGHSVIAYDLSEKSFERFRGRSFERASSPEDVGDRAAIVAVCLPMPAIVREVAIGPTGVIAGSKIKTYIDMSTTGPVIAEEVSKKLSERGILAMDAPVSGGIGGAKSGTLVLMVSGPQDAVAAAMPLLEILGRPSLVGEKAGQGQSMKLINNLMSATHLAITAEAMVLGVKAGLDPEAMLRTLNSGSGRNAATEERFPNHVLPRTFNNGFTNGLMRKDVALCLEMADKLNVPLWVGTAVERLWKQTTIEIGAEQNSTTIVQTVERWAGVEVRGRAAKS